MLVGGGDGNNTGFENVDHYAACGIAGGYDRIQLACYTALRDATQKKIRDFLGIFPKGGGGSSQFPKLLQINQVIFGMLKSFLGAKSCSTIVGR